MTTKNPPASDPKPATNVVSLDSRRDPIDVALRESHAAAVRLQTSIVTFEARCSESFAPIEVTDEQQAAIDAATAQLRDRDTNLARLRAEFAPIAAALAELSTAATAIDAVLRSGAAPSTAQLIDAGRIASAIVNHADIDGTSLYDTASEVWQYAGLLSGELVVAESGDVVCAEQIAS